MEKGGSGIYTQVATDLNETKKGGETSKSKILRILKRGNIGISPTCIKSTGDKIGIPDGWGIYRLGDVVTSVLPLGRHTNPGPILSQRYSSIRAVPRTS